MIKIETVGKPYMRYLAKVIPLAFDESMSYYEQVCSFKHYLINEIMPVINNNAEAVQELQDYLENLDLQDEVDNKLDEMYENGQLQSIIEEFLELQVVFNYQTVSDMKQATNLVNGSYAKTQGFYNSYDNGGSLYKIRTIINTDVVDEKYLISLYDQSLVAELIITSEMNLNQTGVTENDNASDDINKLLTYTQINKINLDKETTYNFSTSINLNRKIEIDGNNATCNFTSETSYLFNILTNYNNKPVLTNLHIIGNDTNGFINARLSNDGWGVSYILKSSIIDKFLNIINGYNVFNAIHENVIFNSDYGYFTFNAPTITNDILFSSCYIRGYNGTYDNYPAYKFNFTNVKNINFFMCAFEKFKGLFNLISSNTNIKLSTCEIEQFDKVANTYEGLLIDETNMLIGTFTYSDNTPYRTRPRNILQPISINVGEVSTQNLRQTVTTNASDFGMHEISYVENTNGNVSQLYNLSTKEWKIYIPINIIQNNGTGITELTTSVYSIFGEQNNEATLISVYTRIIGSDGSRMFTKDLFICENRSSIRKMTQEVLGSSTWNGSAIPSTATITNALTQNGLTTTSSVSCNIDVRIKFEKIGSSY